ncbi:SWIM zinc finger family protein [Nocardia transvalensis]|uniref:SWIM zinc finger family protein n=1 Tax=Nocardia transvalensis TaxID=37333 RepID=UPI002B4B7C6D|nr:SWIM zinc finger family protein [Nocardia transvalensis]
MTISQVGAETTRWTAEQITALAPDTASLNAARKLHGRWRGTGWSESALWGLCKGSGAKPYQTIVDLSGPAYKCTCPSRKFPCKHALALLLAWSGGEVPEAPGPADFAAEWLGARAARAAKSETAAPRTASAATAGQRRARVTAGLEDLDMWLCDQVRTGLAQADRSFRALEAVAARMVDAQAPGVAGALRQLARTVSIRADWPALLLREYARLHLLVAAHRRLDDLSPATAAAVRTHVGYPTTADAVRAEPGVRDRWMVLGRRTTEEERLYTRRVWLRGRTTGRWALIIDHNFGSPTFPADMPAPGLQADAYLHFYPGASPLRALWGERHGIPQPFTTIPTHHPVEPDTEPTLGNQPDGTTTAETGAAAVPNAPTLSSAPAKPVDRPAVPATSAIVTRSATTPGSTVDHPAKRDTSTVRRAVSGSIARALEEYARALGADPWLRSWPMVLAEVVPVVVGEDWYVAEADGTALPLARMAEAPWRLVGLSGGHPVTVIGEWTAEGLVPVSAFTAGEVVDIGAEATGGPTTQPDADLLSAALLGTARRTLDPALLAQPVASAAARLSGDPAAILLETAGLYDTFARGGFLPGTAPLPEPAAEDTRPALSPPSAVRLARMLTEGSPFLAEWFEVIAPRELRAPDALCSLLLEQARTRPALREPLLRLAGARGRWLAQQNPQWRTLVRADLDDASVWSHGRPAERLAWLRTLRRRDPLAARETLADSWRRESGPARAELLAVLTDRLTHDDEPLLESALDDPRADVRRVAADLLARLPDSAFAHRMRQRAARWLRLQDNQLIADLPHSLDDADRRDGIADRLAETAYRADGAPDAAAEWLRRLVAATPLRHWEELFSDPTQAIGVRMTDRMLGPVFAGWADAARDQRDSRWAAALFEVLTMTPTLGAETDVRRDLFALLPLDERVRRLRRLDSSWLAEVELLIAAVPRPWPMPLAEHVLRLLLDRAHLAAARPGAPGLSPASYRSLFRAAAVHFPVEAAATVAAAARRCGDPYWQNTFDQLSHDLTERMSMLEELQ